MVLQNLSTLYQKFLHLKKALIISPTYADYENALNLVGTDVEHFIALEENDFELPVIDLEGKDLVFLCRPNNPTGKLYNREFIKNWISSYQKTIFIIDESYIPFVENEQKETFVQDVTLRPNLIVLRSFGKFYAIAGLRLGYIVSSDENINKIKSQKQPWSVNRLAQKAVEFLLQAEGYKEKVHTYLKKERLYLKSNLEKLPLKVFESCVNFFLLKIEDSKLSANGLKEALLRKHILIRNCSNFKGLNSKYFRISVRRSKENKIFIKSLREIL